MNDDNASQVIGVDTKRRLDRQRTALLLRVSRGLAVPMIVLGFAWLVLLVVDLTSGLSPFLSRASYLIWGLFVVQFVLEFLLAPRKGVYLRRQWLTAVALLVPALRLLSIFRIFRITRAVSAVRGARLLRVVSSANRGMRSLGRVMGRRGFGYVVALTLIITIAGGAGMYALERDVPGTAIDGLGAAIWWTAMTLTTMGSDYFPRTAEGRLLCLLLAIYGFAVFGYLAATVASFFVARDAEADGGEIAGARQVEGLRGEIAALHTKLDALAAALGDQQRLGLEHGQGERSDRSRPR
jgi:voltage-gated potassium channel